jgi:hypothetical protein
LREALYVAAHDTPGGVEYIAGTLGKGVTSLSNNLDLNQPERSVTLEQFEAICSESKDDRLLDAICDLFGDEVVWLHRPPSELGSGQLLTLFNELLRNTSTVTTGLEKALSDDSVIDDAEWSKLSFDLDRFIALAHELKLFAENNRTAEKKDV